MRRAQAQDEALGYVGNKDSVDPDKVNEYKPASAFSIIEPTAPPVARTSSSSSQGYRDEPSKSVNCNTSTTTGGSVSARPLSHCQPGPAIFGQQLSLGSILLGQNASMLRESLNYSRLAPELVSFLEQIVNDVKMTTEEILYQLNEIQKELHVRILREQAPPPAAYSSLPFVHESSLGRVLPATTAAVNPYTIPLMYQSQYRTTVISAPRFEYQNAIFNPHTSL